jgi:WhiB family redox-sensing transcriptional regulator
MGDVYQSNSWIVDLAEEWACHLNDVDHTWHADAACRDLGNHLFFFERGDNFSTIAESKKLCATCPVSDRCLQYALNNNIIYGIWGGKTPEERRRLTNHRSPFISDDKIEMTKRVRKYREQGHKGPVAQTALDYRVSRATVRRALSAVDAYEVDTGEIIS